jgi:superoxide dismutase, Fe-Mn family
MTFQLPKLPWNKDALEPHISAETIEWHFNGHHKAYVDKTNQLVDKMGLEGLTLEKIILNYDGAIYNNAAQAWNHTFYWQGLKPGGSKPRENGDLMKAINSHFGSIDDMKQQFLECAVNLFGSGWTWLITNERGEIDFINTHNADNPIRYEAAYPIWTCDVWEHAYYIDYRKDRKKYLDGLWQLVNWENVEQCFELKRIPNMTSLMTEAPTLPADEPASLHI